MLGGGGCEGLKEAAGIVPASQRERVEGIT